MSTVTALLLRAPRAGTLLAIAISLYQSFVLLTGLLRGPRVRLAPVEGTRFSLLICARNEEDSVADLISDFQAQQYPRDCFEVVVVAHNCTDDTAAVARRAGARVLVLDDGRPGKAHAIAEGMRELPRPVDYVGVFDADSRVDSAFLGVVAATIDGAECLQVETVPELSEGWLANGYGLGRRARNAMWWRPREALDMGVTISGTGWFITPSLHTELGPRLETLTEDLELSILMYSEGHRVLYTSDTAVTVQEPRTFDSSMSQRLRWIRGHVRVIGRYWPSLLRRGLSGDNGAFDMAVYLVAPTRMLTRTGISIGLMLRFAGAPKAASWPLLALGVLSEFGVPALVGGRANLVPMNLTGALLAMRHTLLSLLWFPLGFWGLLTARNESWTAMPRKESD